MSGGGRTARCAAGDCLFAIALETLEARGAVSIRVAIARALSALALAAAPVVRFDEMG